MQIFQRFDEQAATKLDQARNKDTSMEAMMPADKADENEDGKVDESKEAEKEAKTDKKKPTEAKMTKKQRKQMAQMKIFDLKMQVKRPDLVEAWDVTTKDPLFLLECKQVRNSVPVPRHWA